MVAKGILRRAEVEQLTGLPRSTLYEFISRGQFPKPVRLGGRSVGWLEDEVCGWIAARIAERDQQTPVAA